MTGAVFALAVAVSTALAAIMVYEMIDRHRLRYRWANLAVVAITLAALFEIGHQSGLLLVPLCAMLAAWGVVLGLMRRRERRFARCVEEYLRHRSKRRRR